MKLLKRILAAALFALVPATVDASQATYTTPTTGPMSFSTFVGTYLNPALAAVLSNNSGTTAPAVSGQPGTFQFWVDTSTTPRVLKLYDGTSWLALGTIDTSGHFWGLSASTLKLLGSSSGTATITPQAAAGTPTITLPTSTGTLADTVSAPLALNTTTGNVTVTGAAGQVLAGSTPAFTNTPTLGVAGASTGTLALTGVTSGTATITPQATAGSPTLTLPNTTGTFADGASAPLALSTTTGNLTITGAAGQVLAGSTPAFTATPTLGVAGSTVGTLAFANGTSGSITVSPPTGALGAVTLSLPDATDTLIGKATTDTLTNKTYDTAGTGNSFSINGVAATANSGTGAVARASNPAFTTPNIGVATATSVNKMAITAPATSSTLAVADGKTATVNNTLTLAGTDSTTMTFPTTSATIARTDAANTFTGVQTMTSPALTTPAITGLATGSGVAAAATASTLATRDANANLSANAFLAGYTTTATAAGTTTLTVSSTQLQYFTGVTTQTVALPVTSTLVLGQSFTVVNNSSGAVTVQSSGANTVLVVAAGNTGIFTVVLTSGTTAASWSSTYISSGAGTGTVTSVTCGTGLSGGTFTTVGTCALSTPVSLANGGTNATTAAMAAGNLQAATAFGASNDGLSASVGSSALTINLVTAAGATPSSTDPVVFAFRNATAATGTPTYLSATAAQSLVISSGSTMGFANATSGRLWIVEFNDASTLRLGAVNCLSGTSIMTLSNYLLTSSTAEGGAGAADSAQVIYTGTAVTSKAMAIVGFMEWSAGLTTAGTWAIVPTNIQLYGAGIPLPGDVVQIARNDTGAVATGATAIPNDDTIPQNTEGDQYMSQAITPQFASDILRVRYNANFSATSGVVLATGLFRDSTANALATTWGAERTINDGIEAVVDFAVQAGSTSATTFKMRAGSQTATTNTFNGSNSARKLGGSLNSYMQVEEIMD